MTTLWGLKGHYFLYTKAGIANAISSFSLKKIIETNTAAGRSMSKYVHVVFILFVDRDGTARGGEKLGAGVDYIRSEGMLSFKHGESSKTLSVQVNKEAKVRGQQLMTSPSDTQRTKRTYLSLYIVTDTSP